jgi:hypothetical protein
VEPVLPLSIALSLVGGAASALLTLGKRFDDMEKLNATRVEQVDQRMNAIEIRLAKEYVDKEDLAALMERLDNRIDRMDYKLDKILIGYNKSAPEAHHNGSY